jgi:TolB protein
MKLLLILLCLVCTSVRSEIYLNVTGAGVRRAKIAVGDIKQNGGTAGDPQLVSKLRTQLASDLELMNLFEFVPDSAAMNADKESGSDMDYTKWSALGTTFAIRLGYRLDGDKLNLDAQFYDVPGQKRIFSQNYQSSVSNSSRIIHELSESILKSLTGESGLFKSRILMVCHDLKKNRSPSKEVYIVNSDGSNLIQLTADRTLSLSPAWMNDGAHISYTQFEFLISKGVKKRGAVLKKHNLATGARTALYYRDGMNSGATWSSNGNRGIATMSFTGRPELYYVSPLGSVEPEPLSRNLQTRILSQNSLQTVNPNLLFDVEADWSPSGKEIVFSSARSGSPMIYIADLTANTARQITFAGKYNATPAWSPKGDKILFAAQRAPNGNFDIYMIEPDGNNLSRITVGDQRTPKTNHENPSWAPTGRHFAIASNETGHYAIYILTADGALKRRISPEGKECKSPSWGPSD